MDIKLYEEERLEIINMVEDNKLKVDDLGNDKLPAKYKKVSISEVVVYQNDDGGRYL